MRYLSPMITLYQFPPAFGLPVSVSPYCAKVELYLRLTGREYETAKGNLFKSPNRLVPYVRWPDGTLGADSAEIIARLEKEGPALDEGFEGGPLVPEIEVLAAGVHYFAALYARFGEDEGWAHQKAAVKAIVPRVLAPILCPLIRKSQIKRCTDAGFTGHEAYERANAGLARISEVLGEGPFLFGDAPRTVDCSVWGSLVQVVSTFSPNPSRDALRADERLVAYVHRLAERADLKLPAFT